MGWREEHAKKRAEVIAEMKAMHNHICILADTDLVRLIGFDEDETDYYYIVRELGGRETGCSYVGPCISLKGKVERYEQMDDVFALNNAGPTEEFKIYERDLHFPDEDE